MEMKLPQPTDESADLRAMARLFRGLALEITGGNHLSREVLSQFLNLIEATGWLRLSSAGKFEGHPAGPGDCDCPVISKISEAMLHAAACPGTGDSRDGTRRVVVSLRSWDGVHALLAKFETSCADAALGFWRVPPASTFSKRELRLVRFFAGDGAKIIADARSGGHFAALPTRCRAVLSLLLQGMCRQRIAVELGISLHTTNDYIKRIFSNYGVHSQAELMARLAEKNDERRGS
jgi:DNA-binding CsgD family transcriptional regulator